MTDEGTTGGGEGGTNAPTPRWPGPSSSLLLAAQFLTILPIPSQGNVDAKAFGRSLAFFPLVGAIVGALVAGADILARSWLSPSVTDVIVLALFACLTGALHLDGVADTCDGLLAPGRSRDERLAIMRDSRIGSFGVVGLTLLLLLKLTALGALPAFSRSAALIAAPAIGRWAIVYTFATHTYARSESNVSTALKQGATPLALVVACGTTLLASLSLGPEGVLVFVGAAAVAAGLVRLIAQRLGGVTGDVCGATCEAAETLALALVAPVARLMGG